VTCTTPVAGEEMVFFAGWSPGKADVASQLGSRLKEWDKDGDGTVSGTEFGWGLPLFRTADANGNGKLEGASGRPCSISRTRARTSLAVKPGGRGEITDTHVAWKATRACPMCVAICTAGIFTG
jgi:hypothetical protein